MIKRNIIMAAPVKNRGWILPEHIKHLVSLDYPKDKIGIYFLMNDCTDNTGQILQAFKREFEQEYRYIRIIDIPLGHPPDCCEDGVRIICKKSNKPNRKLYTFPALAALRNWIFDLATLDKQSSYLFTADTDILVNPDILNRLIDSEKDIISALVRNGVDIFNFMPFKFRVLSNNSLSDLPKEINREHLGRFMYKIIDEDDLIEKLQEFYTWQETVSIVNRADVIQKISDTKELISYRARDEEFKDIFRARTVGAITLISRKVFANPKIRYYSCPTGEDEGFCLRSRDMGYGCYMLPDLQKHILHRHMVDVA